MNIKIIDANEARDITNKSLPLVSSQVIEHTMDAIMTNAKFGVNGVTLYKDDLYGSYWEDLWSNEFVKWLEGLGYNCLRTPIKLVVTW